MTLAGVTWWYHCVAGEQNQLLSELQDGDGGTVLITIMAAARMLLRTFSNLLDPLPMCVCKICLVLSPLEVL